MQFQTISAQGDRFSCQVFDAADLWVSGGVNAGEALGGPEDTCLGDTYAFDPEAGPLELLFDDPGALHPALPHLFGWRARVADGSEAGARGATITLEARLTFLCASGRRTDVLTLSLGRDGGTARRVALPLAPLDPALDYTLVAREATAGGLPLSEVLPAAFARGTRITLADGTARPVETLREGDIVMTRDHGPRPLVAVTRRTLPATGRDAPVVIAPGALGNTGALVLGPEQRLLLDRRGPRRLGEPADLVMRAIDLVDGAGVTSRTGGYCDYHDLDFGAPVVVFAEGLAAECLPLCGRRPQDMPEARPAALQPMAPDGHASLPDAAIAAAALAGPLLLTGAIAS